MPKPLINVLKRAMALAMVGLLAACAAATPGYVPPSDSKSPLDRAKAFESGSLSANGAYQVSAAERALDCRRLSGSMQIIIARLKDTPNRPQPSALAVSANAAVTTVRGGPRVLDVSTEIARERAKLTAFNGLLAEKKCKTMTLETELAPGKR
jgi:predicted small lipoprotein YifL